MGMDKEANKEQARRDKMQAELNVEFRRTVAKKYQAKCKRDGTEPTLEGLVQFAHEHALIRDTDINRYMTFELYPMALYENNGCKTRAVHEVSDKVPVSDQIIWGWLRNLQSRYMAYRRGRSHKV